MLTNFNKKVQELLGIVVTLQAKLDLKANASDVTAFEAKLNLKANVSDVTELHVKVNLKANVSDAAICIMASSNMTQN